ncbi:MAG TPA: BCAM0308 family protein [Candidatus Binatia bacterium]|nr:BCAM0308 family protein [Candidatus Binatia bacterium]
MRPLAKKYNTQYKKRIVERDSYLPRRSPKGIIQCTGCGAFYVRRHWTLIPPSGFSSPVHAHPIYCPACTKLRDHYPGGELQLLGVQAGERGEIVRILRNEEERAREKNPLERIMRLQEAKGNWKIDTTTEKLAQRLGRSVKKARGGKIAYKWGHNNKFVRAVWEKRGE